MFEAERGALQRQAWDLTSVLVQTESAYTNVRNHT